MSEDLTMKAMKKEPRSPEASSEEKAADDLQVENKMLRAMVATLNEDKKSLESENHRFSQRYVLVEQQTSHLFNLCAASQRLHETLDRRELLGIIQEIVSNIIGSEEMGVFEVDAQGKELSLIASWGIEPSAFKRIPMGQGPIGHSASTGQIHVSSTGQSEGNLTACIPLKLGDQVVGAIAIFRMLPQKSDLEEFDREIFELLATQAGMALHCSKAHDLGAA
jgi:transcriptional regulator with GAF, ATPase, and Fis domain